MKSIKSVKVVQKLYQRCKIVDFHILECKSNIHRLIPIYTRRPEVFGYVNAPDSYAKRMSDSQKKSYANSQTVFPMLICTLCFPPLSLFFFLFRFLNSMGNASFILQKKNTPFVVICIQSTRIRFRIGIYIYICGQSEDFVTAYLLHGLV